MKHNFFSRWFAIGMIAAALVTGCAKDKNSGNNENNNGGNNGGGQPEVPAPTATIYGLKPSEKVAVSIDGGIDPEVFNESKKMAVVSFNRFPVSVSEFTELREQIGKTPEGAVALMLMAYEMFLHDQAIGGACVDLVSLKSQGSLAKQSLKSNLIYNKWWHQIAGHLQGAEQANGFNPTEPYSVKLTINTNGKYEHSETYQSKIIYVDIDEKLHKGNDGTGTAKMSTVPVVRTHSPKEISQGIYFLIHNSPSVYSRDREPSFQNPYKGVKPFGNRY
ncbi:DUF6935 domain-containing protein [Capnocytophaga canimorsus]|uniref:DUF6935 domain-containing protein n=1 Tax=Capnocytophaga canimorsus TaxID=28188 RepID=UPI001EE0B7A5|nr:hypothetical protein [Capnocytophaga canimorsus]GJQ04720.1 hypothetical protein CAPN009_11350 [Capnocytophaga canimorsus]